VIFHHWSRISLTGHLINGFVHIAGYAVGRGLMRPLLRDIHKKKELGKRNTFSDIH
jgi:hypothetical protein